MEKVIKIACLLIVLSAILTTLAVALTPLLLKHRHNLATHVRSDIARFFVLNSVLQKLGYPKIMYFNESAGLEPYNDTLPQFVYIYEAHALQVYGYAWTRTLSLIDALGIASSILGIDSKRYRLLYAEFYPGIAVNSAIVRDPMWVLRLYRVCNGIPIYSTPEMRTGYIIYIDALRGAILHVYTPTMSIRCPSVSKVLSLRKALDYVASRYQWIERLLRSAKSVHARLFIVNMSSLNTVFRVVSPHLYRSLLPVWFVDIYLRNRFTELAIDAANGHLIAFRESPLYPPTPWPRISIDIKPLTGCRISELRHGLYLNGTRLEVSIRALTVVRVPAYALILAKGVDTGKLISIECSVERASNNVSVRIVRTLRGFELVILAPPSHGTALVEISCSARSVYGYVVHGSKTVLIYFASSKLATAP